MQEKTIRPRKDVLAVSFLVLCLVSLLLFFSLSRNVSWTGSSVALSGSWVDLLIVLVLAGAALIGWIYFVLITIRGVMVFTPEGVRFPARLGISHTVFPWDEIKHLVFMNMREQVTYTFVAFVFNNTAHTQISFSSVWIPNLLELKQTLEHRNVTVLDHRDESTSMDTDTTG